MKHLRRDPHFMFLCLWAVFAISLSTVFADARPQPIYLPALSRATLPATLTIPADYMIDSPDPAYDHAGTFFIAVQTIVGKDHEKEAVVYRIEADGTLGEVIRDKDIYGAPAILEEPDGTAVLFGADRDGGLHWTVIPGWVP